MDFQLLESEEYPGYFHVHSMERFVVNEIGILIDTFSGEYKFPSFLPSCDKYPQYVKSQFLAGTRVVHRIIAMAFLECPGSFEDYVINHKNGNKKDFSLRNLEWCTYSHNSQHAYQTGLRTDNLFIEVLDLSTGVVVEHYSLQDVARRFNVNGETIHRYLHGARTAPFMEKYSIRRVNEDWPLLTKDDIGKIAKGRIKDVVVIEVETGKGTIYGNMTMASKATGVKHTTALLNANNPKPDKKPTSGYLFYYLYLFDKDTSDMARYIHVVDKSKIVIPIRKPKAVIVTNLETKENTRYDSLEEFCNLLEVKKNTVQKRILVTGGFWGHFKIVYEEPEKVQEKSSLSVMADVVSL